MDYKVGMEVKRIKRGNLSIEAYQEIAGKISIISDIGRFGAIFLNRGSATFSAKYMDIAFTTDLNIEAEDCTEQVKEMTVSEIEEALGYKIKIKG